MSASLLTVSETSQRARPDGATLEPTIHLAVAHQPNWMPRLKTLCKIAAADTWLILDDVQYVQREWQNRCRVHPVGKDRAPFWLTLPVRRPGGRASKIPEIFLVDPAGTRRHVGETVRHAYRSAPHWADLAAVTGAALDRVEDTLAGTAVGSALAVLGGAGVRIEVRRAAELAPPTQPTARLATVCDRIGATHYLAGPGSRAYLQTTEFDRCGLRVVWQDWEPDLVAGGFTGPDAVADWSSLDFIARYGLEDLARLLTGLRRRYRDQCADQPGGPSPPS